MGNSAVCAGDCRSQLESCQDSGKLIPVSRFNGKDHDKDARAEEVVDRSPVKSPAAAHRVDPGQRVMVKGRLGHCRFIGETQFAAGTWVGIELDEPYGKTNGTIRNISYFNCAKDRGVFVRPTYVTTEAGEPIVGEAPEGAAEAATESKIDELAGGRQRTPGASASAKAKPNSGPKSAPGTNKDEAAPQEERTGSKGRVPGAVGKKPQPVVEEANRGGVPGATVRKPQPVVEEANRGEEPQEERGRVPGSTGGRRSGSEERAAPSAGVAPKPKSAARDEATTSRPAVEESRNAVQEAAQRADEPAETKDSKAFLVSIDKGLDRKKLGADTTTTGSSPYLKIVRVKPDGLIAGWNTDNPGAEVKAGHFIIEVNGVKGTKDKLYDIIVKEQKLTFLVTSEP